MSGPRRRQNNRRSSGARSAPARDIWRAVELPDAPEPIRPSADPGALIRSLGRPPLRDQGAAAEHYLTAVVVRAATVATALATSAGLIEDASDG